jgi:hypothetical protein
MKDPWKAVEEDLAGRARHSAYRAAATALATLIERIRQDRSLSDLDPSISHASLVFRRGAPRSVWVSWNDTAPGAYKISLVAPNLEFVETTMASEQEVMGILRRFLEKAPLR